MIFPDSPAGMSGPVSPESPSPLEAPIYALGAALPNATGCGASPKSSAPTSEA